MVDETNETKWKTHQLVYGIGTPKWFHMKDYYYHNKDKTLIIKVNPYKSMCFSTNFITQLWVGKNKRTLVAEFKGEDDCLITITTTSGLSGLTLLNWYKKRLNLINASSINRVGTAITDKFPPCYKEAKVKTRK